MVADGWQNYDIRYLIRRAEAQGLALEWNPTVVHFIPLVYEQFNDILLNSLCPPDAGGN